MLAASLLSFMISGGVRLQSDIPSVLQDRNIFTYLTAEPVILNPQGEFEDYSMFDRNLAHPNATKFRVLWAVPSQDLTDPGFQNTLGRRDEEKIEEVAKLASKYLTGFAGGNVDVIVVPEIVMEPTSGELALLARYKYNQCSNLPTDKKSPEPYGLTIDSSGRDFGTILGDTKIAACTITSKVLDSVGDGFGYIGLAVAGKPEPNQTYLMSPKTVRVIQHKEFFSDPNTQIFSGRAPKAPYRLVNTIQVKPVEGAIEVTDQAIVRKDRLTLPFNQTPFGGKTITFDYRRMSQNPMAFRLKTPNGWEEFPLEGAEGQWISVKIRSTQGETIEDAHIGVPLKLQGHNAQFAGPSTYQFKKFVMSRELSGEAGEPDFEIQRTIPDVKAQIKAMTPAQMLAEINSDNLARAVFAAEELCRLSLKTPPTEKECAVLNSIIEGPYPDMVRASVLMFSQIIPGVGTFENVSPHLFSSNTMLSTSAFIALESLYRKEIKEKSLCLQYLQLFANTDSNRLRINSLQHLDITDPTQKAKVLFAMQNDPNERTRGALFQNYVEKPTATFDDVKFFFSDPSPIARSAAAVRIPSGELGRKIALEFMKDPVGRVRAIGMLWFVQQQEVKMSELESLLTDTDPSVQLVFASLGSKVKLPAAKITELKASPYKTIAKVAQEIKTL